jgi:hypothetical protein
MHQAILVMGSCSGFELVNAADDLGYFVEAIVETVDR